MFRLAHISDVHLSPLPEVKWTQLANKRITGFLNWKLNRKHQIGANTLDPLIQSLRELKPDHIAVTGDLVNLALDGEFTNARAFLEDLGSPERVSAICGNHDAYLPGSLAKAIQNWEPYLTSDASTATENSPEQFPFLRIRGEVALIGCNSAEATLPFFATGYFREDQANRLRKVLRQTRGLCRVVMIHHPPISGATKWHKRLIGIKRFQEVIRNEGAELILHGHTHLATRSAIPGNRKPVPVICVPAAGNGLGDHRPAGRYNLFDIEKSGSNWSINWKAFGQQEPEGPVVEIDSASV